LAGFFSCNPLRFLTASFPHLAFVGPRAYIRGSNAVVCVDLSR
jgi:hypothetical protein